MEEWYDTATPEDKHRISRLQVPETLIEYVTAGPRCDLRRRVATHQYLMIMGVTRLRGTLPMLPKNGTTTIQVVHGMACSGRKRPHLK